MPLAPFPSLGACRWRFRAQARIALDLAAGLAALEGAPVPVAQAAS
jgi:hypothetical protein